MAYVLVLFLGVLGGLLLLVISEELGHVAVVITRHLAIEDIGLVAGCGQDQVVLEQVDDLETMRK